MSIERRLIEDSIPLIEISAESAREKSIRHGHISTLHIWWARRPLAACRAAVYASLVPAPKNEEEREKQSMFISELVKWETVKNPDDSKGKKIIEEAKKRILEANGGRPPKVLDCFAGGGSIPLEALRLGCEAYALELNPVAYLILLCGIVYPQEFSDWQISNKKSQQIFLNDETQKEAKLSYDIRKWGKWILEQAKKELVGIYAPEKAGEYPVSYFWVRTITCPNPSCKAELPLIQQLWLKKRNASKVALKLCLDKHARRIKFDIVENDQIDFDPKRGTMSRGSARCPFCHGTISKNDIEKIGCEKGFQERLIAIATCGKTGGKRYRVPNRKDLEAFEKATKLLEKIKGDIPSEELPYLRSIFNVHVYGFKNWGKLFNNRQKLVLLTLCRLVRKALEMASKETKDSNYIKALAGYLGLLIDRFADRNSSVCTWDYGSEGPVNTFKLQALPMIWDYVEIPLGFGGPGDWSLGVEWIAKLVNSLSRIDCSPAMLYHGTATRLPFENETIDAIITDPPYYDSVPYSNLSDFFYVWLKRSIGHYFPEIFSTPLTPKITEIVQLQGRNEQYKYKDKNYFEIEMCKTFQEAYRVLKSDGIYVVVFAHKSTSAWESLISGLISSGFITVASWPLHTERPGRARSQESAALASSIFLVCRKRQTDEEGYFDEIQNELKNRIINRLQFFWDQGIRGADFFISAIGPALEVFGRYKRVVRLSGEEVTVSEFLDMVREYVTDFALRRILQDQKVGAIDEISRFYLLWRWAYNGNKVPFDDARKMAQAMGAESDELMSRVNILTRSGENVELLGPLDRKKDKDLGEPYADGRPAPMIDVLHRLCLMWERGARAEMSEFLSRSGYAQDEHLWILAQAISEVLPDGDKEKQLLQGVLMGKDELSKVKSVGVISMRGKKAIYRKKEEPAQITLFDKIEGEGENHE